MQKTTNLGSNRDIAALPLIVGLKLNPTVKKFACVNSLVGVRGFEPPAPASRRQCSTRLSYTPTVTGGIT